MPRLASLTGQALLGKGRGFLKYILRNPNAYSTSYLDVFGNSVAVSSNYFIVGAPYEDDANGTNSGKAYIFDVTTGALVHTLNNPNASDDDRFGFSVAIDGIYAIVGAFLEDDAGVNSGKAYIFNATTGTLIHTLDNPNAYNTSDNDYFGRSVSISGNYAIVGAYGEDDAGGPTGSSSGKAYIFNVTNGALLYTLSNPNAYGTSDNDLFGLSVAIDGNYAIVGAYNEDDSSNDSGKAYIYRIDTFPSAPATITQADVVLDNPNIYGTSAGDYFGYSVAIKGNYAVVGAYGEDQLGKLSMGAVYIYYTANGTWSDVTLLHSIANPNIRVPGETDLFGSSVAIDDNYVVVGTPQEDSFTYDDSGVVYVFDKITGALVHTFFNPNYSGTESLDHFGFSVAISGGNIIVGAYTEGDVYSNSGIAYTYTIPV